MFRKYLKPFIYLTILIIPFLLFFFKPPILKTITLIDITSGPLTFLKGPFDEIRKIGMYHQMYEQNQKLKKQADVLKALVLSYKEQIKENGRYEGITEFRRHQPFSSVVAHVIGRDPSNWNAAVIIDKGAADGLKMGMPVVTPLAVVGRVVEVARRNSKVILLTDPNFSVAVIVERSRDSGLLTGSLQGVCRLQYLTENTDVRAGDKIITSRLSSSFPPAILVGTVVDIQASQNTHTVDCLVQPAVVLSRLEEVIVVKK